MMDKSRAFFLCGILVCILILPGVSAIAMTVSTGTSSGGSGSIIDVPISVDNAKDLGSMDIIVSYDPSVISIVSVDKGTLNKGMISANTETTGMVSIGIVDAGGINGNGAVAVMKINITGSEGAASPLHIEQVLAYDVKTHVDIQTTTNSGTVTVKKTGPGAPLPMEVSLIALVAAVILFTKRVYSHG
jgi:hypothetical protein